MSGRWRRSTGRTLDWSYLVVRSGRVELWLETRAPDTEARAAIPRDRTDGRGPQSDRGGRKLLYAHDIASETALRAVEEYFLEAIETVRADRANYARSKPARLGGEVTVRFWVSFLRIAHARSASRKTAGMYSLEYVRFRDS